MGGCQEGSEYIILRLGPWWQKNYDNEEKTLFQKSSFNKEKNRSQAIKIKTPKDITKGILYVLCKAPFGSGLTQGN